MKACVVIASFTVTALAKIHNGKSYCCFDAPSKDYLRLSPYVVDCKQPMPSQPPVQTSAVVPHWQRGNCHRIRVLALV